MQAIYRRASELETVHVRRLTITKLRISRMVRSPQRSLSAALCFDRTLYTRSVTRSVTSHARQAGRLLDRGGGFRYLDRLMSRCKRHRYQGSSLRGVDDNERPHQNELGAGRLDLARRPFAAGLHYEPKTRRSND